jgi:PKD repeat protein
MIHKLTWLIILVLGIFNLALADTIISPGAPRYSVLPKILEGGTKNELNKHKSIRIAKAAVTLVTPPKPLEVDLNAVEIELGKTVDVIIEGGTPPYRVTSSNETIADVAAKDYRTITIIGVREGAASVIVSDSSSPTQTHTIAITVSPPEPLKVDTDYVEVEVGKHAEVTTSGGKPPYTATSSNEAIAHVTVKDYRITIIAVREGTTSVIVSDSSSPAQTQTIAITVGILPEPLKVDPAYVEVEVGKTVDVTISGGKAPYIGETSDDGIASLILVNEERMVIEGVKGGTADITVEDRAGRKAIVTVTVIKNLQPPQANFTMSPNQGYATLTVSLDASTSTDDGNIVQYQWTSSDGQTAEGIQTSLTFSQVGTHNITLTVTDNEGATASTTQSLTVNQRDEGVGQAIIIAAGGAQQSNTLFRYSNEFTQRFYRLLKQRGFEDENVYYMNPHAPNIDNLEGYLEEDKHDYKLFDPASELSTAFQQAASKLQAGQQFIFFLHGHASQNNFRIKPDYELSANHLGELLAMLPAGVQQIIILDSCYSGSFFDELAGVDGRILISSADSNNLAWNAEYASFTDTFLRSLGRSFNLTEAFQQAENLIISDKQLFGNQRPWLDDNGDGQYTTDDGRRAAKIYLGKQAVHAAPAPTIHQVHPRQELPKDVNNATLWVRTTPDVDGIRKVRAIIVNPQFVGQDYQGIETNFGRDELELIYNHAQKRYEIVYDGFRTEGMWRILYQAQSKQGIWSDIKQGEVQSQGSSKIATIKIGLNLSSYKKTEPLDLDLQVDGQTDADLYVAIILPDKNFITFSYPSNPSWPNTAQIYQTIKIAGPNNYLVNINLPSNAELGQYSTCGVLVKADAAPLEMSNWIDFHCAEFEVY